MRFDALQTRAATLEKVVFDARELLLDRAEQIREYERRNGEVSAEHNTLHEWVSSLQASLIQAEPKFKEADQTRSAYMERNGALARTLTAREAALAEAKDSEASLTDRIAALEAELANEKETAEHKITELQAALGREQLERAVVEGALQTARKDFSRAMREVMALQHTSGAQGEPTPPRLAFD
jgi:crescentin